MEEKKTQSTSAGQTLEIGPKIIRARKALGMTQNDLAKEINVSRAAVSNWEQDRRLPDVMTLKKLSSVLHVSFDVDELPADSAADPVPSPAAVPVSAPVSFPETKETEPETKTEQKTETKVPRNKKLKWLLLAAAVLLLVLLAVFLIPSGDKTIITPYIAVDGREYLPEDFQVKAEPVEGQPYLKTTVTFSSIVNDGQDFTMFIFTLNEKNGVPFIIDRAESVIFGKNGNNKSYVFEKEDLEKYNLGTTIEANGEWSINGGLPGQEVAEGIGLLLTGRNENGESLQFTGYRGF